MRDKQKFIDATNKILKPEFTTELNVVEDASHLMNQRGETTYTIPAVFTTTGNDETFIFEKRMRPKTDNPQEEIEDYFYLGSD